MQAAHAVHTVLILTHDYRSKVRRGGPRYSKIVNICGRVRVYLESTQLKWFACSCTACSAVGLRLYTSLCISIDSIFRCLRPHELVLSIFREIPDSWEGVLKLIHVFNDSPLVALTQSPFLTPQSTHASLIRHSVGVRPAYAHGGGAFDTPRAVPLAQCNYSCRPTSLPRSVRLFQYQTTSLTVRDLDIFGQIAEDDTETVFGFWTL